jgi:hypothetical protein
MVYINYCAPRIRDCFIADCNEGIHYLVTSDKDFPVIDHCLIHRVKQGIVSRALHATITNCILAECEKGLVIWADGAWPLGDASNKLQCNHNTFWAKGDPKGDHAIVTCTFRDKEPRYQAVRPAWFRKNIFAEVHFRSSPAELNNLRESIAKRLGEVTQLGKEVPTGQMHEREAALKFAKAVAADFLDSVFKSHNKDAIHMLAKELRDALNDPISLESYVLPHKASQHSPIYNHRWKSWTVEAELPAPNFKAVIIKGTLSGTDGKKKEVTDTFTLHIGYDRGTELWKVHLFRADAK